MNLLQACDSLGENAATEL